MACWIQYQKSSPICLSGRRYCYTGSQQVMLRIIWHHCTKIDQGNSPGPVLQSLILIPSFTNWNATCYCASVLGFARDLTWSNAKMEAIQQVTIAWCGPLQWRSCSRNFQKYKNPHMKQSDTLVMNFIVHLISKKHHN